MLCRIDVIAHVMGRANLVCIATKSMWKTAPHNARNAARVALLKLAAPPPAGTSVARLFRALSDDISYAHVRQPLEARLEQKLVLSQNGYGIIITLYFYTPFDTPHIGRRTQHYTYQAAMHGSARYTPMRSMSHNVRKEMLHRVSPSWRHIEDCDIMWYGVSASASSHGVRRSHVHHNRLTCYMTDACVTRYRIPGVPYVMAHGMQICIKPGMVGYTRRLNTIRFPRNVCSPNENDAGSYIRPHCV